MAILIIGISAAVVAVAIIAGYYVMRYMRGSVKVTLSKRGFNPGEKVTGTFQMTTRKDIEGKRLYAALVGEEVTTEHYRDSNGRDSTRTNTREIYRDEHIIEENVNYPAGQTIERSFEVTAPTSSGQGSLESPLGKTFQVGMELFSGSRRNLRWTVEVRLDAKGIDLTGCENVTVNLPW